VFRKYIFIKTLNSIQEIFQYLNIIPKKLKISNSWSHVPLPQVFQFRLVLWCLTPHSMIFQLYHGVHVKGFQFLQHTFGIKQVIVPRLFLQCTSISQIWMYKEKSMP
jgi:hypothetical protein